MAIDKAIDSAALDAGLTDIADAIRKKGGTSAEMTFPDGFIDAIEDIDTAQGGFDPFPLPEGYTLPSNYKKLLFAESSGTQICDTGVHPTIETKIEIAGYMIPGQYNSYSYMTGCYNPTIYLGSAQNYDGARWWGFGNKNDFSQIANANPGIPIWTISKTEARIQNPPFPDVYTVCGATTMSGSADTTIGIFGRFNGRTPERFCPTRFYRERIWDGDTLIRCIYPVQKDGNEVGLYDIINDVYMPNLGTGVLVGSSQ